MRAENLKLRRTRGGNKWPDYTYFYRRLDSFILLLSPSWNVVAPSFAPNFTPLAKREGGGAGMIPFGLPAGGQVEIGGCWLSTWGDNINISLPACQETSDCKQYFKTYILSIQSLLYQLPLQAMGHSWRIDTMYVNRSRNLIKYLSSAAVPQRLLLFSI